MTTTSVLSRVFGIIPGSLQDFLGFPRRTPRRRMTTEEIVEDMTSGNQRKVLRSAVEIFGLCQKRDQILPLVPHLPEIESKTKGLDLGEPVGLNQRILDFAIKTLELYKNKRDCPCHLYMELETFNPESQRAKGNVKILYFFRLNNRYIEFYTVRCNKCGQVFKVIERDYPYTWWGWTKQEPDPWTFDRNLNFPSPDNTHKLVYGYVGEVAMGAPLRGECFLESDGKPGVKIHDRCGGPPVWELSGRMVAIPIWTPDRAQRMGVVDLAKMELTIFQEPFGFVLHLRGFNGNLINTGIGKPFDISKKKIESVIALV